MNQTRQNVHCLRFQLNYLPTMIACSFVDSTVSLNLNLAYPLLNFIGKEELLENELFIQDVYILETPSKLLIQFRL